MTMKKTIIIYIFQQQMMMMIITMKEQQQKLQIKIEHNYETTRNFLYGMASQIFGQQTK